MLMAVEKGTLVDLDLSENYQTLRANSMDFRVKKYSSI